MDERRSRPGGDGERVEGVSVAEGMSFDCARIREVLWEYLDRELGGSSAVLVREHLRRCPVCKAEAAELAKVVARLRAEDPARNVPAALSARGRRRVLWAWTHPVLAWCVLRHRWVSLAAVVLAFGGIFLALRHWRMMKDPPLPGIAVDVRPAPPQTGGTGRAGAYAPRLPDAGGAMP